MYRSKKQVTHAFQLVSSHSSTVHAADVAHGLGVGRQIRSAALKQGRLATPTAPRHQDAPRSGHCGTLPELL